MTAGWLKQNDPGALIALAAADTLWNQVQQLRSFQLVMIVALPAMLATAAQGYPALALAAAYVGLLMLLLDVSQVNWWIIERRREAAQAQDLFDAISFSFARSKSPTTDVARLTELARAQPSARVARNRDWYTPALGCLPQELGRIACMRESATWDSTLRRRWSNVVIGSLIVLTVSFVTWAVFSHQPANVFLESTAVPLSPVVAWALREFREQRDSASAVARIHSNLRNSWSQALSGTLVEPELSAAAFEIASEFLQYRANTSPVPHSVYSLLRDKQAANATATATALLREYDRKYVIS